jgi:hypothetical protein
MSVEERLRDFEDAAPYHYRSYLGGVYSFVEHPTIDSVTQAVDKAREEEVDLVENYLVWGNPGIGTTGTTSDADFTPPAPGGLRDALLVLLALAIIVLGAIIWGLWQARS